MLLSADSGDGMMMWRNLLLISAAVVAAIAWFAAGNRGVAPRWSD